MVQPPPTLSHEGYDEEAITNGDYHGGDDAGEFGAAVHLATVEEKKRRWWRNALINIAFISSWYVSTLLNPKFLY